MKIRTAISPQYNTKDEVGAICQCGKCLFINKSDLTPPVTFIECPECHCVIRLICDKKER